VVHDLEDLKAPVANVLVGRPSASPTGFSAVQ
jgi:hypothetical protein